MLIFVRAILSGLLIALIAANVWALLVRTLGVPIAAVGEAIFLALYVWWSSGGGPLTGSATTAFRKPPIR